MCPIGLNELGMALPGGPIIVNTLPFAFLPASIFAQSNSRHQMKLFSHNLSI